MLNGITEKERVNRIVQSRSIGSGKAILEIYNSDFAVEHKDDKSPLTEADKQSHLAIVAMLKETGIPILSEEGRDIPFEERKDWDYFWMIDPP